MRIVVSTSSLNRGTKWEIEITESGKVVRFLTISYSYRNRNYAWTDDWSSDSVLENLKYSLKFKNNFTICIFRLKMKKSWKFRSHYYAAFMNFPSNIGQRGKTHNVFVYMKSSEKRPTECCMYWKTAQHSTLNEFSHSYIQYILYTQLVVANLIRWVSVKIVQTQPYLIQYPLVHWRAQINC